jgi:hypothetical protein
MLTKQITVPRGQNIGRSIAQSFTNLSTTNFIIDDMKRDTKNRQTIITIKFN